MGKKEKIQNFLLHKSTSLGMEREQSIDNKKIY